MPYPIKIAQIGKNCSFFDGILRNVLNPKNCSSALFSFVFGSYATGGRHIYSPRVYSFISGLVHGMGDFSQMDILVCGNVCLFALCLSSFQGSG